MTCWRTNIGTFRFEFLHVGGAYKIRFYRAMKMLSKASESAPKQKSEGSLDGIPNPVSQASLDDIEAPQPTPSKSHGEAPQQTPSKSHDEAVESPKKSSLDGEELF